MYDKFPHVKKMMCSDAPVRLKTSASYAWNTCIRKKRLTSENLVGAGNLLRTSSTVLGSEGPRYSEDLVGTESRRRMISRAIYSTFGLLRFSSGRFGYFARAFLVMRVSGTYSSGQNRYNIFFRWLSECSLFIVWLNIIDAYLWIQAITFTAR